MDSFYKYLQIVNSTTEIHQTVSITSQSIMYTIEFSFTGNDKELLEIPNELFDNSSIKIYANSSPKGNHESFIEPFIEDRLDEIKVTIVFNFQHVNGSLCVELYNDKSLELFLKELLNYELTFLRDLKEKIYIKTYTPINEIINSSIFSLNSKNNIELEESTINYINNTKNRNLIIGSIPDVITSNGVLHHSVFPYTKSINNYLSILANSNNNSHYHFFGKQIIEIQLDEGISVENARDINRYLSDSVVYIYGDLKNSDQKLTFYRKTFTEFCKSNTKLTINSNLDSSFFLDILSHTKYVYDSYEDGEISAYIKEKKEIVKEYLSISKEIIQASSNLKNNLLKNIITILVLFTTNILLKINTVNSTKLIFAAILLFLIVLILLSIFHDIAQYTNFKNRIDTLKSYFKFISKESKELQTDTEHLLNNELSTMKFMTYSPLVIYIILAYISFLMLLT